MKKIALLAVFALMGAALATEPTQPGQAWAINDSGSDTVSLSETIKVIIPTRYALHLTEDSWTIDLNNVPAANQDWSLNSGYDLPEEACYLVPKNVKTVDDLRAYILDGGVLRPAYNYPAIYDYNDNGKIDDTEKGTLICLNQKILQKFSNDPDGWELSVQVTSNSDSGFGVFGLGDRIMPEGPQDGFTTTTLPYGPDVVASGQGTTGGWLDDLILEGFWFDGTEAAGNYEITVTFSLAGL